MSVLRKIAIATLGCKVNQYDAEAIATAFREKGYEVVDFEDNADVYIVNTCTVTSMGDKKSRQLLRRKISSHPNALIVATGCYAQNSSEEIKKIDGVHIITGTSSRSSIVDLVVDAFAKKDQNGSFDAIENVRELDSHLKFEDMTNDEARGKLRAYVKIQDGCDSFCSYCAVPYVRGNVRSRDLSSILNEVERLATIKVKEIVLTGIHLSFYGKENHKGSDLADVLDTVAKVDGIERIRLSSLDPADVTEKLIERFVSIPKLCNHVHMALQSGDDKILRLMNRKYDTIQFIDIVSRLKSVKTDIAFTTDVIVGFPGETDADFQKTLEFVEKIGFSKVHVFQYSKRAGTPAAKFPNQVSENVKRERSQLLIGLAGKIAIRYNRGKVGSLDDIVIEKIHENLKKVVELKSSNVKVNDSSNWKWYEGVTRDYVRALVKSEIDFNEGDLIKIRIFEANEDFVFADVMTDSDLT